MEGFQWGTVFAAAFGAFIPMLAVLYSNWRQKVKLDGIQDWQDYIVEAVDGITGAGHDVIDVDFD